MIMIMIIIMGIVRMIMIIGVEDRDLYLEYFSKTIKQKRNLLPSMKA